MIKKNIQLFGSADACERARLLMENQLQIKRIDALYNSRVLTLLLYEPISENKLIPLLAQSGISGFRLY